MRTFFRVTSVSALALVALTSGAAIAQPQSSSSLDSVEVRRLVASPAPADQARLAAHFSALADRHTADAMRHAAMGQAVFVNPKNGQGTEMRAHCRKLAEKGRASAAILRQLAAHHQALAGGAASVAPAGSATYEAGAGAREPVEADMAVLAGRASTRADHHALQDYFLAFAKRYDAEADDHVSMAASYRATGKGLAGMAIHCDRLVKATRAVAGEARAAAALHGTLAGKAEQ